MDQRKIVFVRIAKYAAPAHNMKPSDARAQIIEAVPCVRCVLKDHTRREDASARLTPYARPVTSDSTQARMGRPSAFRVDRRLLRPAKVLPLVWLAVALAPRPSSCYMIAMRRWIVYAVLLPMWAPIARRAQHRNRVPQFEMDHLCLLQAQDSIAA